MRLGDLVEGAGRPVAYHASLALKLKNVKAALFLCQFLYWSDKGKDGWIYKKSCEIEQETGLTYREQKSARDFLKLQGLLSEKTKRLEHKLFYKVNLERMLSLYKKDSTKAQVESEHKCRSHSTVCGAGDDTKPTVAQQQERSSYKNIDYFRDYFIDYDIEKKINKKDDQEIVVDQNKNSSCGLTAFVCDSQNLKKNKNNIAVRREAEFENFWQAYPVKKAKQRAREIFKRLNPSEKLIGDILLAIRRQGEERTLRRDSGLFAPSWPHPATWLNQRRWEDDISSGEKIKQEAEQFMSAAERDARRREKAINDFDAKQKQERDQELLDSGMTAEELKFYNEQLDRALDSFEF